jgi:3-oxoacyl-[acyl-carrier-protein] synthase-3
MRQAAITGWGMAVPERVMTNADLERMVETSDEWIVSRTGIKERRIVGPADTTTSLATAAARRALDRAGLTADAIDLIVVGTCTPDQFLVSQACLVQAEIGGSAGAFDVGAACSGFVYALATGSQFIQTGTYDRVLVIGVDTLTRFVDYTDRTTCILFGDGAGAVVLEARPGQGTIEDRGVLSSHLRSDGRHLDKLYVDGGPSSTATTGHLRMEGKEVFRHAVNFLAETIEETFRVTGVTADAIDWFVPHQANRRIIDATARKLGIDSARVVVTVEDHGNTSAASIPLALATACADGRIKPGQLVLIEAMGGGFTWGSALIRW